MPLGSYVGWALEAEEPPEAGFAVEGLLTAWSRSRGGRICAVPLAGAVQRVQPQGTQNKGGCEPSALCGSGLSHGLPRLLTHIPSGTGCSG